MRTVTLFLTKVLLVSEASVDKDEGRSVVSLSAIDGCTRGDVLCGFWPSLLVLDSQESE